MNKKQMYKHLSVLKLNILENGNADFSGKKCIFKKDTILDGNLTIIGRINGVIPLTPSQTLPIGLVAFWPRDLEDDSKNAGSNFGNYSSTDGNRLLLQFPTVPNEPLEDVNIQFTPAKEPRSVAFFADNDNGDFYIASTNVDTGIITYTGPIDSSGSMHGLVYDPILDRYLALRTSDGGLIAYDPSTGADTELNPSSASIVDEPYTDGLIVGNTVFFTYFDGSSGIETDPIYSTFNRTTGSFTGNVNWTGDYQFTGTEFKNIVELKVSSFAYDPEEFKVFFLLENGNQRLLAFYQSTSAEQLEMDLLSGDFDITFLKYCPNDFLHAIVWFPVPDQLS